MESSKLSPAGQRPWWLGSECAWPGEDGRDKLRVSRWPRAGAQYRPYRVIRHLETTPEESHRLVGESTLQQKSARIIDAGSCLIDR